MLWGQNNETVNFARAQSNDQRGLSGMIRRPVSIHQDRFEWTTSVWLHRAFQPPITAVITWRRVDGFRFCILQTDRYQKYFHSVRSVFPFRASIGWKPALVFTAHLASLPVFVSEQSVTCSQLSLSSEQWLTDTTAWGSLATNLRKTVRSRCLYSTRSWQMKSSHESSCLTRRAWRATD